MTRPGARVLVVDDHPVNRELVTMQLDALGYVTESAASGAEAIERWRAVRHPLLLVDCSMPGMDGYETTRRIRELERTAGGPRTVIIACTASTIASVAAECTAAGMDDAIGKPLELDRLGAVLARWLGEGSRDAAPVDGASATGDATPEGASVIDRTVFGASFGAAPGIEREVLLEFTEITRGDLAALRSALDGSDHAGAARVAHRIAGASRMVGALSLAAAAKRLEGLARGADRAAALVEAASVEREATRVETWVGGLA